MTRHFLTLTDLSRDELGYLIQRAIELKTMLRNGKCLLIKSLLREKLFRRV